MDAINEFLMTHQDLTIGLAFAPIFLFVLFLICTGGRF